MVRKLITFSIGIFSGSILLFPLKLLFKESAFKIVIDWMFETAEHKAAGILGIPQAAVMEVVNGVALPLIAAGVIVWVTYLCLRRHLVRKPADNPAPPVKGSSSSTTGSRMDYVPVTHALISIGKQSAWGRWYAAQHLASNSQAPVSDDSLVNVVAHELTQTAMTGEIEIRGRRRGKVEFESIQPDMWKLAAIFVEPDPRSLWKARFGARSDLPQHQLALLPEYEAIEVSETAIRKKWPLADTFVDRLTESLLREAKLLAGASAQQHVVAFHHGALTTNSATNATSFASSHTPAPKPTVVFNQTDPECVVKSRFGDGKPAVFFRFRAQNFTGRTLHKCRGTLVAINRVDGVGNLTSIGYSERLALTWATHEEVLPVQFDLSDKGEMPIDIFCIRMDFKFWICTQGFRHPNSLPEKWYERGHTYRLRVDVSCEEGPTEHYDIDVLWGGLWDDCVAKLV